MASISGVLYIGVTNNLLKRVYEHKNHVLKGFTDRYLCHKLVHFEKYTNISDAISREKQLKRLRREKKEKLICENNPQWNDLASTWFGDVRDPSAPRLRRVGRDDRIQPFLNHPTRLRVN